MSALKYCCVLTKIFLLLLSEHQRIRLFTEGARATLELFVNFYIHAHQQDIDWIKETFTTDNTLRGIEIVYFKGNEATNISMPIAGDLRSCLFVLYISSNGTHPRMDGNYSSLRQKAGPDGLLYWFKVKDDETIVKFNWTAGSGSYSTPDFIMILANTSTSIDFTFLDSSNNTLGVQFPVHEQVFHQLHFFGIPRTDTWTYCLYTNNTLINSTCSNHPYFKLDQGLYIMTVNISNTNGSVYRALKYSLAVSNIKIYPVGEHSIINMDLNEKIIMEVNIRNVVMNDDSTEYSFQPKFRGQLLEYQNFERFKFDKLGRKSISFELQSDVALEDFMDIVISDVLRLGLLTYFPMKIIVKEPESYKDEPENETTPIVTPPVDEFDMTSMVFPPLFDDGFSLCPADYHFPFLLSLAALINVSAKVPEP